MSLFEPNQWEAWAKQWGLMHHSQRGQLVRNEWMIGAHHGYLLRIEWIGGMEFYVLVRFPKQADPAALRERLLNDPALATLPRHPGLTFIVEETSLIWQRALPWNKPTVQTLQRWVEQLLTGLAAAVPTFDGRCEQCGSAGASFLAVDGIPGYLCGLCQDRLRTEGQLAERRYATQEANYAGGALLGGAAAAAGGGGWALLAIATQRISALEAIGVLEALGIAWMVSWAYVKGAGKIDRAGQLICAALTMAAVVLGDVLFYAQLIHRDNPDVPFGLEGGWTALLAAPHQLAIDLLFGLGGVLYVFKRLQRPQLTPTIERASP